jgi:RND family efflux transporter MFP subunit
MDFSRLRVQVYVPETEAPFIKKGLPATITIEEMPGRTFHGTVTRFSNALDESTKTMLTEIELANADRAVRPGTYASVRLSVERKPNALLVPRDAVAAEKAGSFVYTVLDGKVHKVPVHVGFNDGVNVELADGVRVDEPVILVGKQTLTDGQPVTIAKPK